MSMIICGFGGAFLVIPTVINLNHSDPVKDSFQLSLWFMLTSMGDVIGIMIIEWMMEVGINWNYTFIIFMMIFLSTGLLQHFLIEEGEKEEKNRN